MALASGTGVTSDDVVAAQLAADESLRWSVRQHRANAQAHRDAAQTHRDTALAMDLAGRDDQASRHRRAARADDDAADADDLCAERDASMLRDSDGD
jgi:hypothetical protein